MRNIFLFIRRYFNFLSFLALQALALSFLFRYNKFHEAAFAGVANEITGRVNEQYNTIDYYFKLKRANENLVKENVALRVGGAGFLFDGLSLSDYLLGQLLDRGIINALL